MRKLGCLAQKTFTRLNLPQHFSSRFQILQTSLMLQSTLDTMHDLSCLSNLHVVLAALNIQIVNKTLSIQFSSPLTDSNQLSRRAQQDRNLSERNLFGEIFGESLLAMFSQARPDSSFVPTWVHTQSSLPHFTPQPPPTPPHKSFLSSFVFKYSVRNTVREKNAKYVG